ncbi:MAG: hypothetical protein ACK4GM_06805 [Tabrizicola sp.]
MSVDETGHCGAPALHPALSLRAFQDDLFHGLTQSEDDTCRHADRHINKSRRLAVVPKQLRRAKKMAAKNSSGVDRVVLSIAAVLLLGTAAFVVPQWTDAFAPAAWAQEGGGDGGQGKGGPGEESEGKGPKAGSG